MGEKFGSHLKNSKKFETIPTSTQSACQPEWVPSQGTPVPVMVSEDSCACCGRFGLPRQHSYSDSVRLGSHQLLIAIRAAAAGCPHNNADRLRSLLWGRGR